MSNDEREKAPTRLTPPARAEPTMTVDAVLATEPPMPVASDQLVAIIEALVFASPEPLLPKVLFKLLDTEPREDVDAAVEELKRRTASAAAGSTWSKSLAACRLSRGPSCTNGCAGCSTSERRRSSRFRRSRRSRSSRTSSRLPRPRSPRFAA